MRKLFSIFILALFVAGLMAQGGKSTTPEEVKPKKLVDIKADLVFPYKINEDSSVLCLVGNFAAHHNGAIITADSAVRYGDDRLECFGNVLINQNTTYAYADRADYNGTSNIVNLYSRVIKVVDEDATLYTYNFSFNTLENVGRYWGGGVIFDKENRMESRRGYYYSDLSEIVGVDEVELSTPEYDFKSDSTRYNLDTEYIQYFDNTNIWNNKGDYFFADEGIYDKSRDLIKITKSSYMLRNEQEMWSDSLEYYRTRERVTLRSNVQIDDTTNKTLAFGDRGEYWGDLERALLTKRPLVIGYDTTQSDSLFLKADTIELITHNSEVDKRRALADSIARVAFVADSTRRATMADSLRKARIVDSLRVEAVADSLRRAIAGDSLSRVASEKPKSVVKDAVSLLRTTAVTAKESVVTAAEGVAKTAATGVVKTAAAVSDVGQAIKPNSSSSKQSVEQSSSSEELTKSKEELREIEAKRTAELKAEREAQKEREREAILEARHLRDSIKIARKDSLKAIKLKARSVADSIKSVKRQEQFAADSLAASERMIANEKVSLERLKKRNAYLDALKAREARKQQKRQARIEARNLARGIVTPHDHNHDHVDSLVHDSLRMTDSLSRIAADSMAKAKSLDSLMSSRDSLDSIYVDSIYRLIKAYSNVRSYRSDFQSVSDSLVNDSRDSTLHLYIKPIIWNEKNQITADVVDLFTKNGTVVRADFQGDPIMASEIDTVYFNQVKGKTMSAHFRDGQIYRNNVDNNVETIYFMQDDDTQEVTTMVVVQSGSATFYIENNELDGIAYRTDPIYTFYPLDKIPASQSMKLKGFEWHAPLRPLRKQFADRVVRASQRSAKVTLARPLFPIDMSIQSEIIRLIADRQWEDRTDVVSPQVEEWLNALGVKSGQPRPERK